MTLRLRHGHQMLLQPSLLPPTLGMTRARLLETGTATAKMTRPATAAATVTAIATAIMATTAQVLATIVVDSTTERRIGSESATGIEMAGNGSETGIAVILGEPTSDSATSDGTTVRGRSTGGGLRFRRQIRGTLTRGTITDAGTMLEDPTCAPRQRNAARPRAPLSKIAISLCIDRLRTLAQRDHQPMTAVPPRLQLQTTDRSARSKTGAGRLRRLQAPTTAK